MGQECFYRENRQDRAEEEILLTERLAEGCGETHWRIRPMTQRENEGNLEAVRRGRRAVSGNDSGGERCVP